jgi:hypothetical protein
MSPEQLAQILPGDAAQVRRALNDPAVWNAQAEHISAIEKQFGQTLNWPESEYQAWWQNVVAEAKDNPIEAATLPVLDSIRTTLLRAQTQRAMLIAGLQVLQTGPGALSSTPDPTTGVPFTYSISSDGFELRSTAVYNGKPITMSFPAASQPSP